MDYNNLNLSLIKVNIKPFTLLLQKNIKYEHRTLIILLAIPFGDLTPENKNELINYYQFIYNTKVCILQR
jgi:hypothetical protein